MNKIGKKLMKLFGYIPVKESEDMCSNARKKAELQVLTDIVKEMERINGTDADQWCKHMYASIRMRLDAIPKTNV